MLPAYSAFEREIDELEKFCESMDLFNSLLSLDTKRIKSSYKQIIETIQSKNEMYNKRKYDYSLFIITLYGCFEQYIENFVKDYLMLLVESVDGYKNLPPKILENHVDLSIELIKKLQQTKYAGVLTKENIIKNLNECIQNDKCLLNYDAFCQHSSNFRVSAIQEVLRNIGLSDIVNRIKRNEALRNIYILQHGECNYDGLNAETIFFFLNELADRRNFIAHGTATDLLSTELQKSLLQKVKCFVREMDEIGFEEVLPYLTKKSEKVEKVYEMEIVNKVLCFQLSNSSLSLSDIIIGKNTSGYTYYEIESIEIDHIKYEKVTNENPVDVGVKLNRKRQMNEEYWIYRR